MGSNLSIKLKNKYPQYQIIAFDNLKRRGSELNIGRLKEHGIEFVHGDIRNTDDFESLPAIDVIIDSSAEPSVLAGIDGGQRQLININLVGTINIMNLAAAHKAAVLFLSTSRIYPIELLNQIDTFEAETRFAISENQTLQGISTRGINEQFPIYGSNRQFCRTYKDNVSPCFAQRNETGGDQI